MKGVPMAMRREIGKRAQGLIDEIGPISKTVQELILFVVQHPGHSSSDFPNYAAYQEVAQQTARQWREFATACRYIEIGKITDKVLIGEANDRLVWDAQLSQWILTDKCKDPSLEFRQEAIDLLLRATKRIRQPQTTAARL